MADDYFQLSWDLVQKLLLIKNNQLVELNKNQCGLLTEKLLETLANVHAEIDSLPPRKQALFCKHHCREALQELYRVVTEAAMMVRRCCIQDWLNAAVKLINNTEAFVDPLFQLEWCAAVIGVVVAKERSGGAGAGGGAAASDQIQRHVGDKIIEGFSTEDCVRKMEGIRCILKSAALEDHGSLTKRLQERQKSGFKAGDAAAAAADHEQEARIVANMLKLKPTSIENNKKVPFLPNIEPKDLGFVKKIGGGSFGDVYEVRWLGQSFAKKTFQGFENESFKHEAAILAGLSHPHIVRLFGISIDKRHGCSLVMELMSEDLHACIVKRTISDNDQAPFELAVALGIMLQIAEGMEYLHHRKITHRDLKSSNILVDPVENVDMAKAGYVRAKVADFGLAKTKDTSATFSLQSMVGTTRWRAPELYDVRNSDFGESEMGGQSHRRSYPKKADVYSYAVTCSEILTGDIPFKDEKLGELSERIKYAGVRPHLPASVPPSLASLIERSWDADASKRPSFSQICAELRQLKASLLIGGEQLVRALRSPTYSAREWRERKTMYQAFLGAAEIEGDRGSESVTRVLLIGSPTKTDSEITFIQHLCNNDHNIVMYPHDELQAAESLNRLLSSEKKNKSMGGGGSSDDRHTDDAASDSCSMQPSNINSEWKHRTLPLCIHLSKGVGGDGTMNHISTFLKGRNSQWTLSSWLGKWQVLLRKGWLADREHGRPLHKMNDNRIHVVWLLYSPHETVHLEWVRLKEELANYELPVQLVITPLLPPGSSKSSDHHHQDSADTFTADHNLQKNFLDKRRFLFPNVRELQDHIIVAQAAAAATTATASSDHPNLSSRQELYYTGLEHPHEAHGDSNESPRFDSDPQQSLLVQRDQMIRNEKTRQLRHLDPKALWASAEVLKTITNIQQSVEIICDISARLGKRGTNIAIAPFMTLPRRYTLAQSGIFTLRSLCKIWEVPKLMETAMLQKLASWELGETSELGSAHGGAPKAMTTSVSWPGGGTGRGGAATATHDSSTSPTSPTLSLGDGRYLHFCVRATAVILYCKALHPKGWIQGGKFLYTDYSVEFDDYYSSYQNQFDEITKTLGNSLVGISIPSQILHTLFPSSSDKHLGAHGSATNLKQHLQTSLEDFFVEVVNRTDLVQQ